MPSPKEYNINFTGDVMLGRLIDQLFPTHVSNAEDESHIQAFRARHSETLGLNKYTATSPWGTTLPLFTGNETETTAEGEGEEGDAGGHLNIINLETSITTFATPWPHKAFNYRMHPANAAPILAAAKIDFACLANNHTLDFGTEGLVETVWTLKHSATHRVAIAGAGETTQEAISPAILELPRSKSQRGIKHGGRPGPLSREDVEERNSPGKHLVHIYAATDHPQVWSDVPTFHLIDYSERSREHLRRLIRKHSSPSPSLSPSSASASAPASSYTDDVHAHADNNKLRPPLKIFSIHWGPNYCWHPSDEIRSLAHFLIFECGIDIVHGHSSHHVQGIECPAPGKVIIYGCGDFVDDYALNREFRNDLGALYRVVVREDEEEVEESGKKSGGGNRVKPVRLEIFPVRINHFQAHLLGARDARDSQYHEWVVRRIRTLTEELMESSGGQQNDKSIVRPELGHGGQLVIDLV